MWYKMAFFLAHFYISVTPSELQSTLQLAQEEVEPHSCLLAHLPHNSCTEEGNEKTTLSCKTAPLPHTHIQNHITVKTINTVQVSAVNTSVHLQQPCYSQSQVL